MAAREKRVDPISPALIKFGVALAFSLGGILCTFLKLSRPSKSKPSTGKGSELSEGASALRNSISQGRDGFLLAEVDHLINKHNMTEHAQCDLEIKRLNNEVIDLEERERSLEIQLLDYYGLQEQENAVIELQTRLRIHNMEAKLYNLKIDSLQSGNMKLKAQVADYEKVVTELESAKAKIKLLRKKLRLEAEQNREHILSLQERVMKLKDDENKTVEIDGDLEMETSKMKELVLELEEIKRTNGSLKMENYALARKLDCVEMLGQSDSDEKEIQALKEENHNLRHQNQDFTNEIEQLKADRCMDIEELVYLRWINACLRYELRNVKPGPDETIARDLSKTLSPKSEQKAKQLILEYANREGPGDHGVNISDFYSDQGSTSRASYEHDDFHMDNNKTNKMKVFAKLMKLLRGKDGHDPIQTQPSAIERAASDVDMRGYLGNFGADAVVQTVRTSSRGSSANSVDLQRSCPPGQKSTTGESSNCSHRGSDDSSISILRGLASMTGYNGNLSAGIAPHEDTRNGAKTDLLKYAEALKKSHVQSSSHHRRSASYSSF